jgi:hypothetical protein
MFERQRREYDSQGQALSAAKRVAPGCEKKETLRPERPKYAPPLLRPFRAGAPFLFGIQGRRASLRSALAPGYHIPRLRRCLRLAIMLWLLIPSDTPELLS